MPTLVPVAAGVRMSLPLFRDEVLQARRARWLGAVVLDHPPGSAWGMALCAAAAGLLVALLATGEYTRRTRVAGQLVPSVGTATVVAPVAGIVTAIDGDDGEPVAAGAVLATVHVPSATPLGDAGIEIAASLAQRREATRAAYEARRRRLAADAAALAAQQADGVAERAALDAEIATRTQQIANAEAVLARYRALQATRLVAELQLQQQLAAVLDQQGARQSLQRQRAALSRQLGQLAQALAAIPDQQAQLDADEARELALLAHDTAEQRTRRGASVHAPVAGRIGTRLVLPGQSVQAGQPLLTLLPAGGELQAHLQVPGRAIAFVGEGERVRLRYDAFPYQRFGHAGGRVLRIARDALAGSDGEAVYRVVVALDRQTMRDGVRERPLRPGLAVQAELHGETRPLWRWAIEPLRSVAASVAGTPTPAARDAVGEPPAARSADSSPVPANPAAPRRRVLPRAASRRGRSVASGNRPPCRGSRRRRPADLFPTRVGTVWWCGPRSAGFAKERVMRELTNVELELVDGGNPILVGALIGAGVIAVGSLALLAYGVSEGCSGSLTISSDSIEVEVTCPPPSPTGG